MPQIKAAVSPKHPNHPEDRRNLQDKLANTGYAPRVADKPQFQKAPAQRSAPKPLIQQQLSTEAAKGQATTLADGLNALLDGVERYQRAKGLKPDRLVTPGGPTEQTLDAQNEKARKARLDLFTDVSRKVLDSDDPKVRDITNKHAAEAMAGLIVGRKVQTQRDAQKDDGIIQVQNNFPTVNLGRKRTAVRLHQGRPLKANPSWPHPARPQTNVKIRIKPNAGNPTSNNAKKSEAPKSKSLESRSPLDARAKANLNRIATNNYGPI